VSKQDLNSNLKTKVPPEDVKKLAIDALKLIGASPGNLDVNQEFMSRKDHFAATNDRDDHASRDDNLLEQMPDLVAEHSEFRITKREAKRRYKIREA